MQGSRVIDNLKVDKLREEGAAKEEEKRQRGPQMVQGRGGMAVVGWAGGVVQ